MITINETNCTIEHQGRKFTANGAFVSDSHLVCYLGERGTSVVHHGSVTTWSGEKIGVYRIDSSWRNPRGIFSTHTHQVTVWLKDGRRYTGRSQGPGMVFRGKRVASQLKS